MRLIRRHKSRSAAGWIAGTTGTRSLGPEWSRFRALFSLVNPSTNDFRRPPNLILVTTFGLLILVGGCREDELEPAVVIPDSDPAAGRTAIVQYGCGSCHSIPGAPRAHGRTAPPLDGWVNRAYVAGDISNTPENLIRWIQNPRDIDKGTAMPDVGVTEREARDIAAYLYTLH